MKPEFGYHNLFREDTERFFREDPQLRRAAAQPFAYVSALIDAPEFRQPGIFMLTGGRQVGKTTFLKQLIAARLRNKRIRPGNAAFLTGELLRDDDELRREIGEAFSGAKGRRLLVIDEVGYVRDWDKAVKFLADAGVFEDTTVILSGSDSMILREAMKRFAGRRGAAERVDFTFHPLSFAETVRLKHPDAATFLDACAAAGAGNMGDGFEDYAARRQVLERCFSEYLTHGGYLTAIADRWNGGAIRPATFRTYSDWLRGDILKHGRMEKYLLEVLHGILRTYASQISWQSLAKDLSIEHHKTVSDYVAILADMNAVLVQEALSEHTRGAAPKKAKKLYFADPFILSAVETLLDMRPATSEPSLVETVAVAHARRAFGKTFYIKGNKGEVDLAWPEGRGFVPAEVKWTEQLRPAELKQIGTYPNGMVLGKAGVCGRAGALPCWPLIWWLLHLRA